MGATQSGETLQEALTNIISKELANQVASSAQTYSGSTVIKQTSNRSSNCKNVVVDNSSVVYVATSAIFQNQDVYQSAITNITNELTSTVSNYLSGLGFGGSQTSDITEIISTTVQNYLTSNQLDFQNQAISDTTFVDQNCTASFNGVNVYIDNTNNIYTTFYKSYSSQASVQETSTTISNIMAAQASNTKIGVLQLIVEILGLLLIVLVIGCLIGATMYILTLLKTGA